MEERAKRIAHILRDAGCGPNDRVCIFTGKNIHAYCGILGSLKSGSCWVPLGENYPIERLKYLIDSVAPRAIIVEVHTLKKALALRDTVKEPFELVLLGEISDVGNICDERSVRGKSTERPVLPQ